MQINQFLPNISYGDAISNYALEIQKLLINSGFDSTIFVNDSCPKLKSKCTHYKKYRSEKKNIIIYHYSIGSKMSDFILDHNEKIILIYHNMTPAHYFKNLNYNLYKLLLKGQEDLPKFKNKVALSIGVSKFNANELQELGFNNVVALPIIINYKKYDKALNRTLFNKYNDDYINILFVGRISPNKKQDDLIKTFYLYKKFINKKSRLFIIGNHDGMETYHNALKNLINKLNLTDVVMPGIVPFKDLATYYKMADIFLSMSEHEGFCVPLLECMYLGTPIIAYNSTAIPETLKETGILFNKKNYAEVSYLIDYALKNKNYIIKKQKERLKFFEKDKIKDQLLKIMKGAINE